jgi:Fe-S cluster assembly protein SufB
MVEPRWASVHHDVIDYQSISYYSAPKSRSGTPNSLDDIDPELLDTYNKLGIPLGEQKRLAGVAVDAVFDSISVATTFQSELSRRQGAGWAGTDDHRVPKFAGRSDAVECGRNRML